MWVVYDLHFKLVVACCIRSTHGLFHLGHALARKRRLVYDCAAPEQHAVAGNNVFGGVVGGGGAGSSCALGCDGDNVARQNVVADDGVPFAAAKHVNHGGGGRHAAKHSLGAAALPHGAALKHDDCHDVPHCVRPVLV